MAMISRTGKNTVTSHFEFMKASLKEKETKMDPSLRVQSKVDQGKQESKASRKF